MSLPIVLSLALAADSPGADPVDGDASEPVPNAERAPSPTSEEATGSSPDTAARAGGLDGDDRSRRSNPPHPRMQSMMPAAATYEPRHRPEAVGLGTLQLLAAPASATGDTLPSIASSPSPVGLVAENARRFVPAPATPGTPWRAPWVISEIGVRTHARWGALSIYADRLARVDVQTPATAGLPTRARVSERQRVGLELAPSERIEVGVELSRRRGHGPDPLVDETRATAQVRYRFGR